MMELDVSQLAGTIFHQTYTYINKTVETLEAIPLLVDIFKEGRWFINYHIRNSK